MIRKRKYATVIYGWPLKKKREVALPCVSKVSDGVFSNVMHDPVVGWVDWLMLRHSETNLILVSQV